MQQHILEWYNNGYTPVPTRTDGSKAPAVNWKQWQQKHPTPQQLNQIFNIEHDGYGVITGTISGNLEMLEAEGTAVKNGILPQLAESMADHRLEQLWAKITNGYSELTPSGGIHYYYRVSGTPKRNTKLARQKNPDGTIQVLLETRGEGGFSVVAPSGGRTHPTGKPWTALTGSVATIPTITAEERDTIYAICQLFDEEQNEETENTPPFSPGSERPGDDYNQKTDWADILTPQGWQLISKRGKLCTWLRPGKQRGQGISATTGRNNADNLFVFSTSTIFEAEKPYSKFAAYALLNHNGDYIAAARTLREQGYGQQETRPALTLLQGGNTAALPIQESLSTDFNEDAMALAFVDQVKTELKFCPQKKQWLIWSGSRWVWDEAEEHREKIRVAARSLPTSNKAQSKFKNRCLSAAGVSAIARLSRTDRRITVHIEDLDANPYEINTPIGVVDLRSGTLKPAEPVKLHTRTTTVGPDFRQISPAWDQFLKTTFSGDSELISYMQRLLGQALIGLVTEQILPFAYGIGANGKSTLLNAVSEILGIGANGYAAAAPAELLMQRKHAEHPAELAQLAGTRLVICSELEDDQKFAESRIKQLTGKDPINARFMFGNPFTFTPSHTFILAANHKPKTSAGGPALWRRIKLIPFTHIVPSEQRNTLLPQILQKEYPAILAWLIKGAAEYVQNGIAEPPVISKATEEYQSEEDSIGRFVTEYCYLLNPTQGQTKVKTLYEAYKAACYETGDDPVSVKRLTQELRARWNVESARTRNLRLYKGILLKIDEADRGIK